MRRSGRRLFCFAEYQDALVQVGEEIRKVDYDIAKKGEQNDIDILTENGVEYIEWSAEELAKLIKIAGDATYGPIIAEGGSDSYELMAAAQKALEEIRAS